MGGKGIFVYYCRYVDNRVFTRMMRDTVSRIETRLAMGLDENLS